VDSVLGWEPERFGYLALVGGVGMGFGMIFVNQLYLEHRLNKIVSWGFALAGAGLIFFAMGPYTIVHFFGLLFAGFGSAFVFVPIQTILQSQTPLELQGRILAIQNMILNFSLTLPILILGKVADQYGIFRVFFGLGVFSILIYVAYRIRAYFQGAGIAG
jgi:predicted MFS family arabinose efflux permease